MKDIPSKNIEMLRERMCAEHLDAYILPVHDPHHSIPVLPQWDAMVQYIGCHAEGMQLIVTPTQLAVCASGQIDDGCLTAVNSANATIITDAGMMYGWLAEQCCVSGASHEVALDAMTWTEPEVMIWQGELRRRGGITLRTNLNLLPPLSDCAAPVLQSDPLLCRDRLASLRIALRERHADGMLVARQSDVRWLLCLPEGAPEQHFPAYLLVSTTDVTLFPSHVEINDVDEQRLLSAGIHIRPYHSVAKALSDYFEYNILLDPDEIPFGLYRYIGRQIIKELSPVSRLKAVKNKD